MVLVECGKHYRNDKDWMRLVIRIVNKNRTRLLSDKLTISVASVQWNKHESNVDQLLMKIMRFLS